ESGEVLGQTCLGVLVGVVEDRDAPAVAAVADLAEKLKVLLSLADGQHLLVVLLAVASHAVEGDAGKIRLGLLEDGWEAIDLAVAVVQVVNDREVVDSLAFQFLKNRKLILRLAEPS